MVKMTQTRHDSPYYVDDVVICYCHKRLKNTYL